MASRPWASIRHPRSAAHGRGAILSAASVGRAVEDISRLAGTGRLAWNRDLPAVGRLGVNP
jgi:hypothetical protein